MIRSYLLGATFLLVFTLNSCKDKNATLTATVSDEMAIDTVLQNYDNGEISRSYIRIGGKIEGEMKDFYPTGELKSIRYFENDKQEGKTTVYFPSGAVKEVQYYENGMRQRADTMFFESGKIEYITEFKDEKMNGIFLSLNEDGSVIFEMKYNDGVLVQDKK